VAGFPHAPIGEFSGGRAEAEAEAAAAVRARRGEGEAAGDSETRRDE